MMAARPLPDRTVMLGPEELERYARHIVLREVGGPGQAALKRARGLVIGAGGLGAPALLYLAAAGVGTLGVIDDDAVALSNLQRQVIHGTPEIGEPKVESAAAAIHRLNPHVTVETHASRLVAANALDLIGAYDIVADGDDNFATRYLVSDACFFAKKPLVTGGGRLRVSEHAPGTGSRRDVRRHAHDAAALRERDRRRAQPDLPLPVPRAAAAGQRSRLRGGRHSRRADRRARLAHGARGDPGDRRLRRRPGRPARHVRRPLHAFRDLAIRLGPVQSAVRRASDDP